VASIHDAFVAEHASGSAPDRSWPVEEQTALSCRRWGQATVSLDAGKSEPVIPWERGVVVVEASAFPERSPPWQDPSNNALKVTVLVRSSHVRAELHDEQRRDSR
jgi:hypothetical protein